MLMCLEEAKFITVAFVSWWTQHHEGSTELARISTAPVDRAVATVLALRNAFPAYLLKCYYFEPAGPDPIERNSSLHIR